MGQFAVHKGKLDELTVKLQRRKKIEKAQSFAFPELSLSSTLSDSRPLSVVDKRMTLLDLADDFFGGLGCCVARLEPEGS